MKKTKHFFKRSREDMIFDFFIGLLTVFVLFATIYPLVYVVSMAISDPLEAARGHVYFWPKGFDLTAIKTVLKDKQIFRYYYNTFWYTIVGTSLGVAFTALTAYPLSRREFAYRQTFMKIIVFTMFFSGGMIPLYIVVTQYVHLYNSRWALILPVLTSAWYVIVARSFFESIPDEIIECARIDGASEYRIFAQLVLPLSKPVLAVLALYFAVGFWNDYFNAMLYLGKQDLQPLAMYVRSVVIQSSLTNLEDTAAIVNAADVLSKLQIKYAVIVVSVLPMLVFYPFISRNLEKGLMIGAIKG